MEEDSSKYIEEDLKKALEKVNDNVEEFKNVKDTNIGTERSRIKEEQNTKDEKNTRETSDDVILFFSFDVVNSASFKNLNKKNWLKTLTELFYAIKKEVAKVLPEAELWRILGDEEIFIIKIRDERNICEYVDKIFLIMMTFVNELNKENKDSVSKKRSKNLFEAIDGKISLQSTAWIAGVSKIEKNNNEMNDIQIRCENVFLIYENENIGKKYNVYEFLGNDIDAGFRVSKNTQKRRLAISFELAYFLSKKTEYASFLNIITYKKLKGVWENKLYPIIWYHNPSKYNGISFEKSFAFDECDDNELVTDYYNNIHGNNRLIRKEMFTETYKAICKIKEDRRLEKKIEVLEDILKEKEKDKIVQERLIGEETRKLHFAAICYEPDSERIMILKRGDTRNANPSKWEFGCAKVNGEADLCQVIKQEYNEKFGIDIELITAKEREDVQPNPLFLYGIEKEQRGYKGKGVLVLAKINKASRQEGLEKIKKDIESKIKGRGKYQECKFIGEDEIDNYSDNSVRDFVSSLKEAFRQIKEMKNK